jgi:hypothetical protein
MVSKWESLFPSVVTGASAGAVVGLTRHIADRPRAPGHLTRLCIRPAARRRSVRAGQSVRMGHSQTAG